MREHRLSPEQLAIYRERLTHGCWQCKHKKSKNDYSYCGAEKHLRIKLGFPDIIATDCRFYWKRKK